VAEERRLRRARRARREDDETAVALSDPRPGAAHRAEELRLQVVELDAPGEVFRPDRARKDPGRLLLELDPVADAGELPDHLPEHGQERGRADEEVALGPELLERGAELDGPEAQVERREDDADAVAGEDEEDVLLEERQARRNEVALAVARREEPRGERVGRGVELLPGDGLAGVVLDEGDPVRPRAGVRCDVVGDVVVQQRGAVAARLVLGGGLHAGRSSATPAHGRDGSSMTSPSSRARRGADPRAALRHDVRP